MEYNFKEGDLILFDATCPIQGIFKITSIGLAGVQVDGVFPHPGGLANLQFLNPYELADLLILKRAYKLIVEEMR